MVHSAICHTTHSAPDSGVNTRRRAFALVEQCLHVRAAMNRVHTYHDVAHSSRFVAMHGLVQAAVKSKLHKLAVNRSTAAGVTRYERCAVSNHGCRIGSVGDYDIGR